MYSNRRNSVVLSFLIPLVLISISNRLLSQDNTIAREYEPVVMTGAEINEFSGVDLDSLRLFAFDAASQSWIEIPFQFDERNNEDELVFPPAEDNIAGLDDNDELVFMARDLGDRAFVWLNNADSERFPRAEITITDTLDQNNITTGWAYLYQSTTFTTLSAVTPYVQYIGPPNASSPADTVVGVTYKMGASEDGENDAHGLPDFLAFLQPTSGNLASGQISLVDYFDRFRTEIKARFFLGTLSFDERNFSFTPPLTVKTGNVAVRKALTISFSGLSFSVPMTLFPFSAEVSVSGNIPATITVSGVSVSITLLKLAVDLSSAALSAEAKTSGVTEAKSNGDTDVSIVDGDPSTDNVDTELAPPGETNYVEVNMQEGIMVNLLDLDIAANRELHWRDELGSNSSGDGMSIAENGVSAEGNDIEGAFTLSFKSFFLEPNGAGGLAKMGLNAANTGDVGEMLAQFDENPLKKESESQDIGAVPVELVSFSANVVNRDVELTWVTATETNNFGFDVERQAHGEQSWSKIAFLDGKGTRTVPTSYSFLDRALNPGKYDYRLKQIDTDGSFEYSSAVSAVVGIPETLVLSQNFPNPFNPTTEIQYQLPAHAAQGDKQGRTFLTIYNLLGQAVRTLVDEEQPPGYYSVTWDGRDDLGRVVPSGVYIYRITSRNFTASKKMIFVQ